MSIITTELKEETAQMALLNAEGMQMVMVTIRTAITLEGKGRLKVIWVKIASNYLQGDRKTSLKSLKSHSTKTVPSLAILKIVERMTEAIH